MEIMLMLVGSLCHPDLPWAPKVSLGLSLALPVHHTAGYRAYQAFLWLSLSCWKFPFLDH